MAPLTTWLPARPNRDFDLIIKIVGLAASGLLKDWTPIAQSLTQHGFSVMVQERRFHFVGVHGHQSNIARKIIRGGTDLFTIAPCTFSGDDEADLTIRDVTAETIQRIVTSAYRQKGTRPS
jgi:hypothetical protein